jgi:hypothetical protein
MEIISRMKLEESFFRLRQRAKKSSKLVSGKKAFCARARLDLIEAPEIRLLQTLPRIKNVNLINQIKEQIMFSLSSDSEESPARLDSHC